MNGYLIRRMTEADIPRAAQIERETYPDPWSKKMFSDHLNSASSFDVVLERSGQIIGFGCTTVIPEHLMCIDNITIQKEERQKGCASLLLKQLLEEGRKREVATFTLEVRASNQPAIALYEKFGFKTRGKRKGYYHSPVEDALIMNLEERHG